MTPPEGQIRTAHDYLVADYAARLLSRKTDDAAQVERLVAESPAFAAEIYISAGGEANLRRAEVLLTRIPTEITVRVKGCDGEDLIDPVIKPNPEYERVIDLLAGAREGLPTPDSGV